MDILAKLFGSKTKVKIMRVFLFHPTRKFENADIARKIGVSVESVRKITGALGKTGLIEKVRVPRRIKKSDNKKVSRKSTPSTMGWMLSEAFPYKGALHNLLIEHEPMSDKELRERFKKAGRIRLLLVSGVFIQQWDARVDILVVADRVDKDEVAKTVKSIESEVGKEMTYAAYTLQEFYYRMNINDRFVADILAYPHKTIVDKIGVNHHE